MVIIDPCVACRHSSRSARRQLQLRRSGPYHAFVRGNRRTRRRRCAGRFRTRGRGWRKRRRRSRFGARRLLCGRAHQAAPFDVRPDLRVTRFAARRCADDLHRSGRHALSRRHGCGRRSRRRAGRHREPHARYRHKHYGEQRHSGGRARIDRLWMSRIICGRHGTSHPAFRSGGKRLIARDVPSQIPVHEGMFRARRICSPWNASRRASNSNRMRRKPLRTRSRTAACGT